MADVDYDLNNIMPGHADVKRAVRAETEKVFARAEANLARERASTRWRKIFGPNGLTEVLKDFEDVKASTDGLVILEAEYPANPMAIEYGHQPSGVFGPGGSLEHVDSKAPEGTYILNRAAGLL
jgi:hypothetical protein